MTTTLRVSYQWPGKWVRGKYDLMQRRMDFWCHAYPWFEDGRVEGEPFGAMELCLTIAGNDRWRCLRRGGVVADDVFAVAGIRNAPAPTFVPEKRKGPPPW